MLPIFGNDNLLGELFSSLLAGTKVDQNRNISTKSSKQNVTGCGTVLLNNKRVVYILPKVLFVFLSCLPMLVGFEILAFRLS